MIHRPSHGSVRQISKVYLLNMFAEDAAITSEDVQRNKIKVGKCVGVIKKNRGKPNDIERCSATRRIERSGVRYYWPSASA
jgi:hypothetical protein